MVMTNKIRPRIASALLAGAFAVVPVAATVALAPSAAAIYVEDGVEVDLDLDALAEKGIAPTALDIETDAAGGDIEFRDEDGNLVDPVEPAEGDVDRSDLTRAGMEPISVDADEADIEAEDGVVGIEPISAEIVPISADVDGGLSTGAIVALVAGGVAVVGAGAGLAVRARKARA